MNLYHIKQTTVKGYDTYSDAVVCAESKEEAKTIHPNNDPWYKDEIVMPEGVPTIPLTIKSGNWYADDAFEENYHLSWTQNPEEVTVIYLGVADAQIPKGVICASYHAG